MRTNQPVVAHERRECTERIYKLWDEIATLCPQSIDKALRHCMRAMCDMVGADDACWYGLVRVNNRHKPEKGRPVASKYDWDKRRVGNGDSMMGWRIGAVERMIPLAPDAERLRYKSIRQLDDIDGHTNRAIILHAGRFRAHSLYDGLVNLAEFTKTQHYNYFYRESDIGDRMWVLYPISETTESCFVLDVHGGSGRFCENAIRTVKQCLRGIRWFHYQALLSHGLGVSEASLTPTERRVVALLLTGAVERDIAEQLGVSPGTAHQYCVIIYQKYGVRGRLEFMALWLNMPDWSYELSPMEN